MLSGIISFPSRKAYPAAISARVACALHGRRYHLQLYQVSAFLARTRTCRAPQGFPERDLVWTYAPYVPKKTKMSGHLRAARGFVDFCSPFGRLESLESSSMACLLFRTFLQIQLQLRLNRTRGCVAIGKRLMLILEL